jgi:hypothetical protein
MIAGAFYFGTKVIDEKFDPNSDFGEVTEENHPEIDWGEPRIEAGFV